MMEDYFNQDYDVKLKDARPEYSYQVRFVLTHVNFAFACRPILLTEVRPTLLVPLGWSHSRAD